MRYLVALAVLLIAAGFLFSSANHAPKADAHGDISRLICSPDIIGGDGPDFGIRFRVFAHFAAVEMEFTGGHDAPGEYSFSADLRRGTDFTTPIISTANVTSDLPNYDGHSFETLHFDFGYTPVDPGGEQFTLVFHVESGPGTPFYMVGSGDSCPDVEMFNENAGSDLTDRGNEPYLRVIASDQASDRWGDANCSNDITTADPLLILQISANPALETPPGCYDTVVLNHAGSYSWIDTNCSGHFDAMDALRVLRYLGGVPDAPFDCPNIGDIVDLSGL